MKSIASKFWFIGILFFAFNGCTNLEEEYFNQIAPSTFYNSQSDVAAALARVYEHTSWALHSDADWWKVSELSSDHFVWTQKGRHGYDQARWIQLHGHSWTYLHNEIFNLWRAMYQGIGYAYNTYNDFETVVKPKAENFGLSLADIEQMQAEMLVLAAIYHNYLMDAFGPTIPIFTPETEGDARPASSSGMEVFHWIEQTLLENLPKLGQHQAGTKDAYYGRVDKATCAAFLTRLYLNAEVTVGTPMFDKAEEYAQRILDGEYGIYELDDSWQLQFNYNNDLSKSIIWAFPCEKNQLRRVTLPCGGHYQAAFFYRSEYGNSCNGVHLQPSQTTDGEFFEDKYGQGSPYQKYYDGDERRVPYFCNAQGQRQGIFSIGTQSVPGETYLGRAAFDNASEEWRFTTEADTLYVVDRVGRFSEIANAWASAGDPRYQELVNSHNFKYLLENATKDELASIRSDLPTPGEGVTKGEENSGFRYRKYPIYPDEFEAGGWNWNSDFVAVRLAEIYYTLAECKLRKGDVAGAAELLDAVRKPYFTQVGANEAQTRAVRFANGEIDDIREPPISYLTATTEQGDINEFWRNASYVQNPDLLDMDEMLDEWGREFIGEGRRMVDLKRFDKYTNGRWWNKNVDTDSKYEILPIPQRVLVANENIVQNPGYQTIK